MTAKCERIAYAAMITPSIERVRVGHHQRQVLAGARLALVGVDDEVLGHRRRTGRGLPRLGLRDEAPLHAGREAGAAAAAQAGVLDQRDELVGRHRQRRPQGRVALEPLVGRQPPGLVGAPAGGEHGSERHGQAFPGALAGRARLGPRRSVGAVVPVGQGAPGRLGGAALRGLDAGRLGRARRRTTRSADRRGIVGRGLAALLGQPQPDAASGRARRGRRRRPVPRRRRRTGRSRPAGGRCP